ADIDEAAAILTTASAAGEHHPTTVSRESKAQENKRNDHWRWRLRMAECVAAHLDPERFGVKGFYVHGSTKNATAGENSDINILIHFDGTPKQREHLQNWLEGWSLSLDEANYLRTGHRSGGLLDVQFVTDADIRKRNGYATKINAVTDPARLLPMGTEVVDENRDGE
ncbi:MAG: nucleotidyltransferase domain-containing protein, partial [Calditrichaeota bacterium]|nr:nucleotidyltransferase domain-containing protein [Calditrichota bacterium]